MLQNRVAELSPSLMSEQIYVRRDYFMYHKTINPSPSSTALNKTPMRRLFKSFLLFFDLTQSCKKQEATDAQNWKGKMLGKRSTNELELLNLGGLETQITI